jgi:hypothetical protein
VNREYVRVATRRMCKTIRMFPLKLDSVNNWRDSVNDWRDSVNNWRDSVNNWRDSVNDWRDSVNNPYIPLKLVN